MIKEIVMEAKTASGPETLKFGPGAVTVFVGPNNAGKSLTLREIDACLNIHKSQTVERKIVKSVLSDVPDSLDGIKVMLGERLANRSFKLGQNTLELLTSRARQTFDFAEAMLPTMLSNPAYAAAVLGYIFAIFIGGGEGVALTEPATTEDLQTPPTSHLSALFRNSAARERLRTITKEAFGYYFVIDPTALREFRVRMAKRLPVDEAEEQGIGARARDFHKNAIDIAAFSNGVRSYVGILMAVQSAKFRTILIDEPEAFLHPPLAHRLGSHLSGIAQETGANVIAATHSADFMSGCIESGVPVNIVRLTYQEGTSTARLLPSTELTTMMRDPLLRSVGVISAFFYEGAVVTEAAADRAFYQEINHRLLTAKVGGHDSCVYLNAQNKQTACRIAKPLRRFGVPAAVIVDIDVLKEGGANWTNLLSAAGVPNAMFNAMSTLRGTVHDAFKKTGKDMKRDGGIALLSTSDREACQNLFDQLASYGVFVTPYGELESWLKHLSASGHGSNWLIEIFEKMGSDPAAKDYQVPAQGDVWEFVRSVSAWVRNPNRKGMAV